jgi:uncharacterized membrane protein YeiB
MDRTTTLLSPVAERDRIPDLDVVRGFALLGIFLMNVEFFGRALADLDNGMVAGTTGIDHWVDWLVYVLVRGKFWTLFSLLFGMGFAVMLTRAKARGAGFTGPYVRRTLALGLMGAAHCILLWGGDILLGYAIAAAWLLLAFELRGRTLLMLGLVSLAIAAGLLAWGQRGDPPVPATPFLLAGLPLLVLALVAWAMRTWPLLGMRNAGLAMYLLPFALMVAGAGAGLLAPSDARMPAEQQAARAAEVAATQARIAGETRVMHQGSYGEAVAWRLAEFPRTVSNEAAFSMIVLGVFLVGAWLVRSGIMLDPGAHLALFRRLAWAGIPLGVGLGLVGTGIAATHVRGDNDLQFTLATGLTMLGNLPASLGYLGAVVVAFHGRWHRLLAWLAPAGRMALTNYLLQSLVGVLLFHGYALGLWGMGRTAQVLLVLVVFLAQVACSHWWLARFRYGPVEWLWRAATYLQVPPMVRGSLHLADGNSR